MTCSVRLNFAVLASVLLVGCTTQHDPYRVPVTMMGTQGIGQANQMTARPGDTAASFAKRANLDIQNLLELNGLVDQSTLQAGQRLTTPLPPTIKVIEGDSVDTISRALGIERKDLVAANNLQQPYILTRGQVLQVPQQAVAAAQARTIPSAITTETLPPVAPVESGVITTTQSAAGQKVHNSASGTIVEEDLAPPVGAVKAADSSTPMTLAPTMPPTSTPSMQTASLTPPAPAKPVAALGTGVPRFSWPVNGSVLSEYGPKSSGQRNDGLNIGAPLGTPVRAAAPGEVVYVGDNVAGFGNLVLVRHSGGFATAYGHVQNTLVKRGDQVNAGEAIAQVGKSGNVTAPQLHFEIRKGTQHTDPQSYLP